MKKFLQIFALCALCVLAAPMVFAQNDEPVITATKDNVARIICQMEKDGTVKLVGEIDTETISSIEYALQDLSEDFFPPAVNLDMSKTFGLKEIPSEAFFYANCLSSIVIPSSVENIGNDVFKNCTNLKQIIVDENNEYYKSVDGVLYSKDESVLVRYPAKKREKSFNILKNVKSIADDAFLGCTNLVKITVDENNENYVSSDGVLYNKDKTSLIYYPANKTATAFVVPDGVENIAEGAFNRCKKLQTIKLPSSVKNIGDWAFDFCTHLKYITIPDGVKNIGEGTFYFCKNLETIIIPGSINYIGHWAFRCCFNLKNITISEGMEIIGNGAFESCCKLKNIILPDGLKKIEASAFRDCSRLESVIIPESLDFINVQVFYECKNLKALNYKGSKEQWDAIDKGQTWNDGCPSTMKINFNYQE